jgi:hypothetical protein
MTERIDVIYTSKSTNILDGRSCFSHFFTIPFNTNATFAGRSARRRMK